MEDQIRTQKYFHVLFTHFQWI